MLRRLYIYIYKLFKLKHVTYFKLVTCRWYFVTKILHFIFHIKPHFFQKKFQGHFLSNFEKKNVSTKEKLYVVFCAYFEVIFLI